MGQPKPQRNDQNKMIIEAIKYDAKNSIAGQVCEHLIAAIKTGHLQPGQRLPGERTMATQLGISRNTVTEALNQLEHQDYIERIPARGTFIADDVKHELKKIKIVFPFPEVAISAETFKNSEDWSTCSEVYHGMLAEAKNQNVELIMQHFEESEDKRLLTRQMRIIKNYDGAIFLGELLKNLRQEMQIQGKTYIIIAPSVKDRDVYTSSVVTADVDHELHVLAQYLAEHGYKRLWIATRSAKGIPDFIYQDAASKNNRLCYWSAKAGISVDDNIIEIEDQEPFDLSKMIATVDFSNGSEVIFFNHCKFVVPFYEYCHENHLRIGEDIGVVGYASGIMFQNLVPSMTYSKIDHFSKGQLACKMMIEKIRNHDQSQRIEIVPNKLIIGKSTAN
jgi:DNA-binding LacI/PurR family transcriptional regulator